MLSLLCGAVVVAYENRLVLSNTLYYDVKKILFFFKYKGRVNVRS